MPIDIAHIAQFAAEVTPEQIKLVSPLTENGQTAYMVLEEDRRNEHKVTYHPMLGFFCSCPDGVKGFLWIRHPSGVCSHCRFVVAYLLERKRYEEERQQADEPTRKEAIEKWMQEHYLEIDGHRATYEEVEQIIFKLSSRPTEEEVKRDQERYGRNEPFKLM